MKAKETTAKEAGKQTPFCLNRQQIVDAKDIPTDKVFVPEWADGNPEAYVVLKGLTAKERAEFEDAVITPESKGTTKPVMDSKAYGLTLAMCSMCDDDLNRLFTAEDVTVLEGKSALALSRVIGCAMRLNGITSDAVDKAAKN